MIVSMGYETGLEVSPEQEHEGEKYLRLLGMEQFADQIFDKLALLQATTLPTFKAGF